MSKRSVFTTVTALDAGITRETVLQTLHNHVEMIDLNPLVIERHPIKPPSTASPEEFHCQWYQLTDQVKYLPGGLVQGKVSYDVCFHDLSRGLQTHCLAPAGLDIKGKWTLGGSLPGEPKEAPELGLGVPKNGLWLREDVDMRCNILMLSFVKKTLKKAHSTLVARLVEKAHLIEAQAQNDSMFVLDARRDSSLPGCGTGLRPGYQSGPYSDTSSLRSSRMSQSPHVSHQFSTPLVSPSYQNVDPGYRDARDTYQNLPPPDTAEASKLPVQPQLSYAMELPAEIPSNVSKLQNSTSTVHHELPARFFDKYD
ncbi:MAG: hypothetical protein Q9195_003918 [Heterodermia aff. obscurata]